MKVVACDEIPCGGHGISTPAGPHPPRVQHLLAPRVKIRGHLSTSIPSFLPYHALTVRSLVRSLIASSQLPFDRSHAFLSRSPRGVDIRPSQLPLLAIPSPTTPRLPHLVPQAPQTVQSPPFPLFFLFFVFRLPFSLPSLFCLSDHSKHTLIVVEL